MMVAEIRIGRYYLMERITAQQALSLESAAVGAEGESEQ